MINKKKEQSEILMEIPEEFLSEEEEPEEELTEPEDRQLIASKRTHNSFNEDFEDSEDFEQRLKSLTDNTETSSESNETNDLAEGDAATEEDISKEPISEDKQPEKPVKESNNKYSSSSWSLKDREVQGKIPNPVYTCNGSGKVVVKIEVNQNGYVTDTKIDKKKSSTRNECLFDNAMEYARQALFSAAEIKEQKGVITYYFNYSE